MIENEQKIRLIICDDQTIVCEGLSAILTSVPEVKVVGIAHNGREAINLIPDTRPDLILMDLKMPVMNGIQATKIIKEKYPTVAVLVLTTYDSDEWVIDAIRSGAAGYLLKDTPGEDLIRAIVDTMRGRSHIDPQIAGKLLNMVAHQPNPSTSDRQLLNSLSDREREILQLLGRGLTNSEIAKILFLSEGTTKNYVSAILSKLNFVDRTQAALFAVKVGLSKSE
ncbi:MAG: response regulator transcription factor [Chloroflexi bacterium]|nr:response regulator transcription factor [Chloroflexota bacterium]